MDCGASQAGNASWIEARLAMRVVLHLSAGAKEIVDTMVRRKRYASCVPALLQHDVVLKRDALSLSYINGACRHLHDIVRRWPWA